MIVEWIGRGAVVSALLCACGSNVAVPNDAGATDGGEPDGSTTDAPSTSGSESSGEDSSSGGESIFEGPYGSGNRLTAHVLRAAGGAEMLQWFYDEELGIECTFAQDPEGVVRCLPRGLSTAANSNTGPHGAGFPFQSARTASDCETPAIRLDACDAEVVGRFHFLSQRGCGVGPVVREPIELGAPVTETGDAPGKDCTTRVVDDDEAAFILVPVDYGLFAAATSEIVDGVRVLSGEDGSWQNLEVVDPASGRGCGVGTDRCIPSPAAYISDIFKEGEDCNGPPVGGILTAECEYVPTHAIPLYDWDGVVVEVTGSFDQAARIDYQSRECVQVDGVYWSLGEEVSPDSLMPLQRIDVGEGGVVARHVSHDDVPRVARSLVDASTGDDCEPWFDGERYWCVPSSVWVEAWDSALYLDADCTEAGLSSRVELPFGAVRTKAGCATDLALYELELVSDHGDEPLYRADSTGACTQNSTPSDFVYRVTGSFQTESVLYELIPATL